MFVSIVAPAMNLNARGVTDRTIELEWEGSIMVTDFLVTYTPSSPGGKERTLFSLEKKQNISNICCVIMPCKNNRG